LHGETACCSKTQQAQGKTGESPFFIDRGYPEKL